MAKKINMPNGTMFLNGDLTLQEQHDLVDSMTSMCAYTLFMGVKENLLDKDPEFIQSVFKGVTCRVDEDDAMLVWEVDATVLCDAKRAMRRTLEKLVVKLPEYESIQATDIVAPNQGDIKEIVTSKAFELVQAYVLRNQEKARRKTAKTQLKYQGFMYGMTRKQ